MKGTRILALALAAMLVITLVPALAEEAPVKISVAGYMFGPVDNDNDVITPLVEQMLKEKHGINVDIEVVYIEQANYSEILKACDDASWSTASWSRTTVMARIPSCA